MLLVEANGVGGRTVGKIKVKGKTISSFAQTIFDERLTIALSKLHFFLFSQFLKFCCD
jgi:hypothetical protein